MNSEKLKCTVCGAVISCILVSSSLDQHCTHKHTHQEYPNSQENYLGQTVGASGFGGASDVFLTDQSGNRLIDQFGNFLIS